MKDKPRKTFSSLQNANQSTIKQEARKTTLVEMGASLQF